MKLKMWVYCIVIFCINAMMAIASDPTAKEIPVPDLAVKMTPVAAKSLRYIAVDYGVPGSKLYLHEFKTGTDASELHYIDILTPNGKRLQRFQLALSPEAAAFEYRVRPLWLLPAQNKLASLLFESKEGNLMIVFAKGFSAAGSQQYFSGYEQNKKRLVSFDELDRKGFRMVRIDIDEDEVGDKPAFKASYYYLWNGTKFVEKHPGK